MGVKIIGLDETIQALEEVIKRFDNYEVITRRLADDMERFVHRLTGYLASTIEYEGNFAGASAPYAGYEADRGGDHDYAQRAIDAFDFEDYLDYLMEPFNE